MSEEIATTLVILLTYIVGAIPFGVWLGHLLGVNLLGAGSGNSGATNAARLGGWRLGVTTLVLDVSKGAFSAALGMLWGPRLAAGAATSAVFGHIFSPFLGFRGGKGVASALGGAAVVMPVPCMAAVLSAAFVIYLTRIVSVGSLVGLGMFLVGTLWLTGLSYPSLFGVLVALVITARHRDNLSRLVKGRESRLFAPKDKPSDG